MVKSGSFFRNLSTGIRSRLKKTVNNPYRKVNMNWFTLKYLKHAPANKLYNHKLLNYNTWFYDGSEYLHGLKEIFIEEVYKQNLPENAEVLDCGAHIGLSIIYIKQICPTAHIVAFEPDARNFNLLKKNLESRSLSGVELKEEAIWIKDTTLQFVSEGSMGSKIDTESKGGHQQVIATRLKKYLTKKIDFLKMDIEGAEYKVIKDIEDDLEKVANLFIEYHGSFSQNNELLEILDIVHRSGFHFYIKEAMSVYDHPFTAKRTTNQYDIQLNIFCSR
jgi:FkbM family methyltransferase